MILALGGDRAHALRNLGRAVEALAAQPRAFDLPKHLAKEERLRIATKARGTVVLQGALVDSLDRLRDDFLHAAFGTKTADSGRTAEADDWTAEDEQNALAAADAMSEGDLATVLAEAINLLYEQGVAHARTELGVSFAVDAARAKRAIDERALTLSKKVVDDERAALKAIIRDAFEGGSSIPEIRAAIVDFFGEGVHTVVYGAGGAHERVVPIDTWANTVARTEVATAQNAGIFDLYSEAGVATVRWLTADDERVCPQCEALDGEIVPLGTAFSDSEVAQPPAHPNCRCTLVSGDAALPAQDEGAAA